MTEQHTYFFYRDGFLPQQLPLGSLVLDYKNPMQHRPYRFTTEKRELSEFAFINPSERPFLQVETKKSAESKVSVKGIFGLNHGQSGMEDIVVAGPSGAKVELQEPEEYFKSVILKSDKARFWLESRLTVQKEIQRLGSKLQRSPEIWILTGLRQIEDASTFNVSNTDSKKGGEAKIPIPDPSGMTTLLGLTVGASIKLENGSKLTTGAKYPGLRIWAAQWQKVEAKYKVISKWNAAELSNTLKLLDVVSTGNQRAGDQKDVVEVELASAESTGGSELVEDSDDNEMAKITDEYWAAFDRELKDMVDDYPDYEDLLI